MSTGAKKKQASKRPIRRCNIENCANPMCQNPAQITCRKFMKNKKKGLCPFNCFWYCYSETSKKQRMENFGVEDPKKFKKALDKQT